MLSSKIPTGIMTDYLYGSWEMALNGWWRSGVLFVDRAYDVYLSRFSGVLSSKIPSLHRDRRSQFLVAFLGLAPKNTYI